MKLHNTKLFIFLLFLSTVNYQPSTVLASVTISSGETVTFAANENWIVNGSLAINSSGTLDASSGDVSISLSSDWSNAGTFTAGGSTVTFTGAGISNISGTSTFYSLTCTAPGKQLTFESGKTQTITNILKLRGSAAAKITLRASTAGTAFTLDSAKAQIADYLDVKDASFTTERINCYHSTDSGNNGSDWHFADFSIDSPAAGTTTGRTPVLLGKAGLNDTVNFQDLSGSVVAETSADSSGHFLVVVTTPLATGSNSLTAYVDTIASDKVNFDVSSITTPEQVPEITPISSGSGLKGDLPAITGMCKPSATVYLLGLQNSLLASTAGLVPAATNAYYTVATRTADAEGNFFFTSADYKNYLVPGVNRFMVMVDNVVSNIMEITVFTPLGTVFDDKTNLPLSGARVSLYKTDGTLAQPGVDLAATDDNPQTTGSDGSYGFAANNGTYYITVTDSGYSFPSQENVFATSRLVITGSKGENFSVSTGILQMDLPLDPDQGLSCYPNPFDPYKQNLTIQYFLSNDSEVKIAIYDLLGNLVRTWETASSSEGARKGINQLPWDGRNGSGDMVANGGYILLLHANGTKQKFKILVVE